ncbi:hypothetical protein ACQPZX_07960 [Actinoplanes sp. CA-142083]|uniref:hypothetical protein n=1 Tax=Actinoplanes sp. CA-142083 TaxID=3239903 RepID=UPI003D925C8C
MSAGSSVEPARTFGVSLGHRELSEADHWILSLSPAPVVACTHLVSEPYRHVAISLTAAGETFPTSAELQPGADAALTGKFGRAVIFPGSTDLVGTLTVEEILSLSAIAKVEVLGSGGATPDQRVDTCGFVRPQYRFGELVLTTTPAAGGLLVPFETRDPTPCCANH